MEIPDELIKRAGKIAEAEFLEKRMKEESLSNKEWESTDHGLGEEVMAFWKKDVKEAVKKLKEEIWKYLWSDVHNFDMKEVMKIIDKRFGDKLI